MAALPRVISLMGPTAAGKTDLAIALCEHLGCELISVDSAMVYRGLDIGSAKPSAEELARAPHRLIDIRDPANPYSVADFVKDASAEIARIVARGATPLLVGGTMLYFNALLHGLSPMPPADPEVRAALENEARARGWPAMHAKLATVDPTTAARLHPNHSQRIARALEVYRISGKPMSAFRATPGEGLLAQYRWCQLAIAPFERSILHRRIAARFDKMLACGFIEEVEALYNRADLSPELPAIRSVGYRQVWRYLAGEVDFDEMREQGVAATRQLAKRQLTWLRNWHDLSWLNTQSEQGEAVSSTEILNKALNIIGGKTI